VQSTRPLSLAGDANLMTIPEHVKNDHGWTTPEPSDRTAVVTSGGRWLHKHGCDVIASDTATARRHRRRHLQRESVRGSMTTGAIAATVSQKSASKDSSDEGPTPGRTRQFSVNGERWSLRAARGTSEEATTTAQQ
jgi:hypothetical protein